MLGTILFLSALTQTDGGASFSYGGGGGGVARQNGIRESSTFPNNCSELYFQHLISSGVLHNMGAPPPPTRGSQVLNHLGRRDGDQTGEN